MDSSDDGDDEIRTYPCRRKDVRRKLKKLDELVKKLTDDDLKQLLDKNMLHLPGVSDGREAIMAALRRTDPALVTYSEAEYMEGVIEELLCGRIQVPGTSALVNGVASVNQNPANTSSRNDSKPLPSVRAQREHGLAGVTRDASQPGSPKDHKPSRKARATKKPEVAPVAYENSQPGSSRDSKPWIEPGDQPAENPGRKVGAMVARQNTVSWSPVLKREPGRHEGAPNEGPKNNAKKEPAEMNSQTTRSSLKKSGGKKKSTSTERPAIYRKLEELWLDIAETRSQSEMEEFEQILKDTYDQRRIIAASPLPEFFLHEKILCKEAEIRFGSDIKELEEKLRNVLRIFSKAHNEEFPLEELTLRDLCRYLEEGTSPSLVTEGPVPKYRTDDSPRIYTMGGHLWINAGTPAETIKIASGSLERALVLCLVLYYVKYLDYPEAFWRVLYVLQFVLNPSDVPPTPPTGRNGQTCEVTEKMRCLVDLLTSEDDTSESKGATLAIRPRTDVL